MSEINEEMSFEEMLNESFKSKNNKIVEGKIVAFDGDKALVDIGEKVEGILNVSEITDEEGNLLFEKNDTVKVFVKKGKNRSQLSYKEALKQEKKKEFLAKFKAGDIIEAKIEKLNKGGFVAVTDGVEFFIPKSESALKFDESNIGKTITGEIMEIKDNSIVLSRKAYVNKQKEKRKEYVESIKDQIITVTVKNIKREGVIIDLGEFTGFVPKDEIFYKNINHMSMINIGDEFDVILIDGDKLVFSIKQTMTNPWEEVKDNIGKGDVINVTVTNLKEYGAFVDIGNGVEGFLHISELSWNSGAKVEDIVAIGDEIDVEVINLDVENERLRVSYKNTLEKPAVEFSATHREGSIVTGKVDNLTDIGGFIEVEGIICFLPNRYVSWTKGEKAKDVLEIGETYDFKVIAIDTENNKIILSRKDLEKSPYDAFAKNHSLGDTVTGKIKNITDFGVFVALEGIEALVRKSDLAEDIENYKDKETLEGTIIELDVDSKRVKLSQK
jgi:small subunit ribosomal protein S1